MGKPSKEVMEFMAKHAIDSDEIWEVHGNSWCIKHKALERAGAAAGIVWEMPEIVERDAANQIAVICVFGRLESRLEWAMGEASPKNNKNAYPYAMAEKRGKDRVILKLLNTHGYLYSESEFDADEKMASLPKKDSKDIYEKLQREIQACQSRDQLKIWMKANKDRVIVLADDWQDVLRLQCEEMMADLRGREAA